MATITLSHGFSALTSVYKPEYLKFTISTGVVPIVTIESIVFNPVKISTNIAGVDTYVIDLFNILKYFIDLPPYNLSDMSLLKKSITATISATGASDVTSSTILCYALEDIAESGYKVADIATYGARDIQYYNTHISFYLSAAGGNYPVVIGGSSYTYTLTQGYNRIEILNSTKTGALTVTGTSISFNVVNISLGDNTKLVWLNRDGQFVETGFQKINTTNDIKNGNTINIYNYDYSQINSLERDLSKERTTFVNLRTVAKDAEHFKQLTFISQSQIVSFEGKFWKVKSAPTTYAECKQNLNFEIQLELLNYAQSY